MTLTNYHNLFFKTLGSKINKTELEEFFFWIIEHYCKINRMGYILNPNYQINDIQKYNLFESISLLEQNMPIQYIIGETEFMGLKYFLNQNVLIPRPETEELVSWILSDFPKDKSILDIGTGSGCIAVSLAKFSTSCEITGWDIDNEILKSAKMLGRTYSISGKIIHGDKRGSEIGFPTANIKLKPNILLSGVYAVFTYIDGKKYYAIANIGYKPTFNGNTYLFEAHIFNLSNNLYGKRLEFNIVSKIRDTKKFSGIEELKKNIKNDINEAKKILKIK